MALRTNFSLLALHILLALSKQALAGHNVANKSKDVDVDVKQPEWLFKSDPRFLIPGIGRMMVPPHSGFPSYTPPHFSIPNYGPSTGAGTGSYVPGGDDTFVPHPGFETPNPGRVGSIPAAAHP